MKKFYRAYTDISIDAIRKNIKLLQKQINKGVKTCAVIKADGYGHGAVPIAENIADLVDFYAVASIEEAMELVDNKIKTPIIILGYIHPSYNKKAIKNDIRLTVFDYDTAKKISKCAVELNKTAKIHIKINTGMNRIGFLPNDESLEIIKKINKLKNVEIEGVFTHFHSADEESYDSAKEQAKCFKDYTEKIMAAGINIAIRHCSNSAATILMKDANFDMVRMGVVIYGLYPSQYVRQLNLTPALSLYSHVTMVKTIKKGDTVGYGATYTAERDTQVATVSIGYADGYLRNLRNKGHVLIHGKPAKICGGVCMDQIVVDISDIPNVKVNDKVVLIGKSKDEVITMEEVAELGGTINYEFACGITRRVTKRYIYKGKVVNIKKSC